MGDETAAARSPKPHPRLPMVPWASPAVIQRAAVRAILAPLFERFADKRDVMAINAQPLPSPEPGDGALWVDFVADTGEGFDSTYTVARIVSADRLPPSVAVDPEAPGQGLPRGRLLVLGGDEVYPYASDDAYEDRFETPWDRALPRANRDESGRERLYAIPGNHDWYDGLTHFLRAFARAPARSIGDRRTEQRRSYFAVPLRHGWWAWGVDRQFDGFIDDAQVQFFTEAAKAMPAGSRIVLVVPEPSWVNEEQRLTRAEAGTGLRGVEFLDSRVVAAAKGDLAIGAVLTGDLHHYARYEERVGTMPTGPESRRRGDAKPVDGRPWITCGGGGAHLIGTHGLPASIDLSARLGRPNRYGALSLKRTEPDVRTSRGIGARAWRLALACPPLTALLAIATTLCAWVLGPGLVAVLGATPLRLASVGNALAAFGHAMLSRPLSFVLAGALVVGLCAAVDTTSVAERLIAGVLHALAHVAAFVALLWGASWLAVAHPSDARWLVAGFAALLVLVATVGRASETLRTLGTWWLLGFSAVLGVIAGADASAMLRVLALLLVPGGVVCATIFGTYLAIQSLRGAHIGVAFATQVIADHKCFLRLRVARDGLTIFPIGIEKVCRRWDWDPAGAFGRGRFEPKSGEPDLLSRARLIEDPIVIR